jgi:cell division protein FtsN
MSLVAGILIGMALGLVIAAAMAWYILKTPSSFVNNVPHEEMKPAPVAEKTAPQPNAVAGNAGEDKPRFEFYKVLTDKQDTTAPAQANPKTADKAAAADTFFLQAGAFSNGEEADKLKARLAMLGMEATVQDANIGDKTLHRVRLGPYKSEDEYKKTLLMLKQNGIDATPTRVQ